MSSLNNSGNFGQRDVRGPGPGGGGQFPRPQNNVNRNQYQQAFSKQQNSSNNVRGGISQGTNAQQYTQNQQFNNFERDRQRFQNQGARLQSGSSPKIRQMNNMQTNIGHQNLSPHNPNAGGSIKERPYMMFVYSQKFTIEGQGEYEIKIANVINPYTMKATPLQPSLIDPTYMMAQGIGNSKKTLPISSEDLPQLIMQQNKIGGRGADNFNNQRGIQIGRGRATSGRVATQNQNQNNQYQNQEVTYQQSIRRQSTSDGVNNNAYGGFEQNYQVALTNRGQEEKSRLTGGASVRMMACSRLYKKAVQKVGILAKTQRVDQKEEQKRERRKIAAANLLKKIINDKYRQYFRQIKMNSWQIYKFREQQKKKRGLQLFKFAMMLRDKQKNNKFFALSKLKENHLSQYQERSSGQDSQGNSKSNNQSYVKQSLNPQDNNYISPTPTTAAQSFSQQQINMPPPIQSTLTAQEVQQKRQQALQLLTFALSKKIKEQKLAFWLPFRATQKRQGKVQFKELKIDFGSKQFNRNQLEEELAKRFNKIEIKKVDSQNNKIVKDDNLFGKESQIIEEDTIDFGEPSQRAIEINFNNVSNIQYGEPFLNQQSRMEDTFIQELQQLNTQRSRASSKLEINSNNIHLNKKTVVELQNFSPLFDPESFNNSPTRQKFANQVNNVMDASSFLVTEEDVKAIKIENNLMNLNKDIMQVNDEIEQIKRLIFFTQQEEEDFNQNDESDHFDDIEIQHDNYNKMFKQVFNKKQQQEYQPKQIGGGMRQTNQYQQLHHEVDDSWLEEEQNSFIVEDDFQFDQGLGNQNYQNYNNPHGLNNSQIFESERLPLNRKRQLVPVNKINNRFRTEEEMLEYYELKALDHIQENNQSNSKKQSNFLSQEEYKYNEEEVEKLMSGYMKKQTSYQPTRERADSIKKNIQKYEKTRRKNLNDSREHDFEGFEEDDYIFDQEGVHKFS